MPTRTSIAAVVTVLAAVPSFAGGYADPTPYAAATDSPYDDATSRGVVDG